MLARTPTTAGVTTVPAGEHDVADPHVVAGATHGGAPPTPRAPGAPCRLESFAVFDHGGGVGPGRHRRPGHDADRLARLRAVPVERRRSGSELIDDGEVDRRAGRVVGPARRTRRRRCCRTAARLRWRSTGSASTRPTAHGDRTPPPGAAGSASQHDRLRRLRDRSPSHGTAPALSPWQTGAMSDWVRRLGRRP